MRKKYNEKVDIWAVGITLFKLLNGDDYLQYDDIVSDQDLIDFMKTLQGADHYIIQDSLFRSDVIPSASCKDFLKQCLTVKGHRRPTAQQLLKHRWILENAENEMVLPVDE